MIFRNIITSKGCLLAMTLEPQRTVIVENDFFILKQIKFNKDGHFLEEAQYKTLKSISVRHSLFRIINGFAICSVCLAKAEHFDNMSPEQALKNTYKRPLRNNNHLNHLFTKIHNPQEWKFKDTPNPNQPQLARQTQIVKEENNTQLNDLFDGSEAQMLRWALVKDVANGLISAECIANSSLAKVAFYLVSVKLPCGATIINYLCVCYDDMLKSIAIKLKMA